jgi:hypothetical protein
MLQQGFRPQEIALDAGVQNNPFKSPAFAKRGVQKSGVETGERFEYRSINNLTTQWTKRFSS